jgi:bifunctional non-homologous end joining protein LigD
VRVEPIKAAGRVFEPRLIGGSVLTLLYAVQIDIVSMDPWLSKVMSPDEPDIAVIDVDPMPGTSFATVVDVVRWTHDLLLQAEIPHFVKTSGMGGMHVVIPLAPASDYRTARIFAQTIADRIATAHPKQATVERRIADRGRRVYLDCDQNMRAKTLAAPYSARHSSFAGVSAPVTWDEVEEGIRPEDFTIRTIPKRLKQMGDLWEPLRRSAGIDIRRLVKS